MTNRDSANRGELLPLPKPPYIDEHNLHGGRLAYSIQQMKEYARANVERALAESREEVAQVREACEPYARVNCGLLERAERLAEALREALVVIDHYVSYEHDGDPWKEDARAMGEMMIDDYARDGRLDAARAALNLEPTP